jgi:hypothetical protein
LDSITIGTNVTLDDNNPAFGFLFDYSYNNLFAKVAGTYTRVTVTGIDNWTKQE